MATVAKQYGMPVFLPQEAEIAARWLIEATTEEIVEELEKQQEWQHIIPGYRKLLRLMQEELDLRRAELKSSWISRLRSILS